MSETTDAPREPTREGGFCTRCGTEVESFEGLSACPACGTRGVPCAWADQVDVSVNWHELRCLVMWAERWTGSSDDPGMKQAHYVVYQIARRIAAQYPGRAPLTFAGEMGAVAAEYDVAVTDPKLRQDIAEQTGREVNLFRPREDRP